MASLYHVKQFEHNTCFIHSVNIYHQRSDFYPKCLEELKKLTETYANKVNELRETFAKPCIFGSLPGYEELNEAQLETFDEDLCGYHCLWNMTPGTASWKSS